MRSSPTRAAGRAQGARRQGRRQQRHGGHRGRPDPVDPGGHPGPRRRDRHRRQRPVGAVPVAEPGRPPASRSSRSTPTSPAPTTCSSTRPTPSRSAPPRSTCSPSRSTAPGEIAILSAAATATNQNAWIGFMKQQLPQVPEHEAGRHRLRQRRPGDLADRPAGSALGLPEPGASSRRPRSASPRRRSTSTRTRTLGQADPHRPRPAVADEAVRQGRHRQVVRAVEPERPRLPRRLRRRRRSPPGRQLPHRLDVHGRQAQGEYHRPGRRHDRPVGRARPADRVRRLEHRPVQLL